MIFLNKECYGLFYLSYETNNQVFGGQFCYEERLTRMTFYIVSDTMNLPILNKRCKE